MEFDVVLVKMVEYDSYTILKNKFGLVMQELDKKAIENFIGSIGGNVSS